MHQQQGVYLGFCESVLPQTFPAENVIDLRQQKQQEQREERAQLEMSRGDIQLGQREITYAIMVFNASLLDDNRVISQIVN